MPVTLPTCKGNCADFVAAFPDDIDGAVIVLWKKLSNTSEKVCNGWLHTWESWRLLYLLVEMTCSRIWRLDCIFCWRCSFLLLAARGHSLRWNLFWLNSDRRWRKKSLTNMAILSIKRNSWAGWLQQSYWIPCSSDSVESFDVVINADIILLLYRISSCKLQLYWLTTWQTVEQVCWKDWFIV